MYRTPCSCFALLSLLHLVGCTAQEPAPPEPLKSPDEVISATPDLAIGTVELPTASSPLNDSIRLKDSHTELGVDFTFENGSDDRALMVQSTGGGAGWIDFDRDTWPDLFFVQGGNPTSSPPHSTGDRLLKNVHGSRYSDISVAALPADQGFGQGMAAGDFDEDGFDDIYITNVSADVLLQNCGDGTFVDVTNQVNPANRRWGASAAWFDLDRDGDLDLFVCNYCKYDVFNPVVCRKSDGAPGICHPEALDSDYSECFENLGDGQFISAAKKWGLADKTGKALGVVAADFNEDDIPDLFVANDTMANFLYLGNASGGFSEQAVEQGCAYNSLGQYQANMGVACNDYDGNGFLDLYITTFTHDSNTLFANLGPTGFRDVTRREGLHAPTIETLGFGTVMTDLDGNGAMDLFITNGHIDDWRYKNELWKMPPEMFTYENGSWRKLSAETAGSFLKEEHLGRAVAMADCDHDGDTDLLVVHQNEPAALLINESTMGHWLRIECVGRTSNRRAIGAKVTVRQGDHEWTQQLMGGTSYLTTHEPVLFFGLGASDEPCEVTVRWPNSSVPGISKSVPVNQHIQIIEPTAGVQRTLSVSSQTYLSKISQ